MGRRHGRSDPRRSGAPTLADVSKALWAAAGQAYAAIRGLGRLVRSPCRPTCSALIGPLFANVNPTNAVSTGFVAANFDSGPQEPSPDSAPSCRPGSTSARRSSYNTAATSCYEDRVGALQVVEPSVLGVQVAYAGYFKNPIHEPGGVVKIAVAP